MKISVVVPAFNEEKMIANCCSVICTASESFRRFGWDTELIVCDNNSTDKTAELARRSGAQVVFEPINQISRARNAGAAAAKGEWLVFVDADSYPTPELFADVAKEILSGTCIAGGSTVKLDEYYFIPDLAARFWNVISRCRKWVAGSFIFCRTDVFREIGGFSLDLFASEEIDFSKRLQKKAKACGKTIVILHRHPLLTSARKLHLYTRRDHARFLVRAVCNPIRTVKDREACSLWYSGKR